MPGAKPNVVLIVIDSVRAQSTSVCGYHRRTIPFLERLAAESVVYDAALSTTHLIATLARTGLLKLFAPCFVFLAKN